jgi:uncharacterized protein YueI
MRSQNERNISPVDILHHVALAHGLWTQVHLDPGEESCFSGSLSRRHTCDLTVSQYQNNEHFMHRLKETAVFSQP